MGIKRQAWDPFESQRSNYLAGLKLELCSCAFLLPHLLQAAPAWSLKALSLPGLV